jgi:hypothetical protein
MTANVLTPVNKAIDIIVTGAPSLLQGLQQSDIQAVAKLDSLGVGQHEVTLDVHLPSYLHVNASYKAVIDISDSKAASTKPEIPAAAAGDKSDAAGTDEGKQTDEAGTATSSPPSEAGDKGESDGSDSSGSAGTPIGAG